ncbi:DUF5610 domain-containing protein [Pseudoalteromonas sp. SSDWG2]|uniref:DUF5610 domain-containing protein n=1 Tax=Pseudoalteromonas sp. SSDWG2 TaxID=3139391 RepID=UPI003BAC1DC7
MKVNDINQLFNPAGKGVKQSTGKMSPVALEQLSRLDSYSGNRQQLGAKVLEDKLAQALGMEPKQQKEQKPLFDFEAIVKNVLKFVTSAVNKAKAEGASDEKLTSMLEQARKGVQMGVDDATSELDESGVLNDEIKEGIAKSQKGINEGIDEFEKSLFGEQEKTKGVLVSQARYMSMMNNAEYRFTTAEGDEVTISLSQDYEAGAAAAQANGNNGKSGYAQGQYEQKQLSFNLSVNGELNEAEQQAVNDMMSELQGVSEAFFSGQYDSAFAQAQELKLSSEQLVGFAMDLTQTKTRAAIREYERAAPAKEVAKELQPFNDKLKDAYDQAGTLGLENELSGLLLWLNQDKEQEQVQAFIDYTRAMFDKLGSLLEQ